MNIRAKARNYFKKNNFADAQRLYLTLLKKDHQDIEALQLLGTIAFRQNRSRDAKKYFIKALSIKPCNHELLYQLGCVSEEVGDIEDACRRFEQAIEIKRDFIDPHLALGICKARQGYLSEAKELYRSLLAMHPNHVVARNNLANVLANQGDIEQALPEWRKVLELQPDYHAAHSNFLLALNYLPGSSRDEIFRQHVAWERSVTCSEPFDRVYRNDTDPDRRIRIAYVSADYRQHSVSYFIESVLKQHDRDRIYVICYSNVTRVDTVTQRLLGYADAVRVITNQDDHIVSEWISEDQIDLLIDLSGHTDGNRLPLFARKPAPVQLTYMGYPNTTGLQSIDYRLTDPVADPDESDQAFHTEELVRIQGGFLCYSPPQESPGVAGPPMMKTGLPTFGVFNNVAKLTEEAIGIWAAILRNIDGSRLFFKNRAFTDKGSCSRYKELLTRAGISHDRISFSGLTPDKNEYLESYNRVDIALDSFPYCGTTTTFDALWMGVPVVTLSGDRHASRVGDAILSRVGLSELVARSKQEYIDIAVSLAGDFTRIQQIRISMRDKLAASPLCDGNRMARELEDAYRHVWKKWCLYGSQ